jgi:1,4-dihydroxy-6-naphthoate synthase
MDMTSLAISPCPNDTFAFHALVHGKVAGAPPVSTDYADIDVLNTWAAKGSHDLVKVSYGALPWLLDDYALLPSGGALGRGCGPLVVTRPGRSDLAGARVAVPGERTTAYLLFRLWAAGAGEVVIAPFDTIMPSVRDGSVDAGLIIHEPRFTYPSFGLVALVDLGDWWEARTGLPIPLGAILVRRTLDAAAWGNAVRASVEAAWADPAASTDYVRAHALEMDEAVTRAHIDLYVNSFTADLGDEGYAAVTALLTESAAAGLTPALDRPLR